MRYFGNSRSLVTVLMLLFASSNLNSQSYLDSRHRHIIVISSYAAKGDLGSLSGSFTTALDSGLTVNEIKEILVHLYAYTGFPRSLQSINTLISVLEKRKNIGIVDKFGKGASPNTDSLTRYERGKRVLESLTGQKEPDTKTGYAAFSPEIEVFLKEHLFADLFTRDILSYVDREIATISALINLGGVEPMLRSHLKIALNLGVTPAQLKDLVSIIESEVSRFGGKMAQQIVAELTGSPITSPNQKDSSMVLYRKGTAAPAERFSGTALVHTMVQPSETFGFGLATISFEPGARSNWHKHPGGQVLLVTSGKGYYQERGSPGKIIHEGDVVKCVPGVEHWHGASPNTGMSHISISSRFERGEVVWLRKVTDSEYNAVK